MQGMLVVKIFNGEEDGIIEKHFVVMVEKQTKQIYYLAENNIARKVLKSDIRKPLFTQWYMQGGNVVNPFWQFEALMYIPFIRENKPDLNAVIQKLKAHIMREFKKQNSNLKRIYKKVESF